MSSIISCIWFQWHVSTLELGVSTILGPGLEGSNIDNTIDTLNYVVYSCIVFDSVYDNTGIPLCRVDSQWFHMGEHIIIIKTLLLLLSIIIQKDPALYKGFKIKETKSLFGIYKGAHACPKRVEAPIYLKKWQTPSIFPVLV